MNTAEQTFLCDLLRAESGLSLTTEKRYLLETRLTPIVRRNDLRSLSELVGALKQKRDPGLVLDVVDAMTTNESLFFRDGRPFDQLRDVILPELEAKVGARPIKIWSAAASTGQEAYSAAMIWLEAARRPAHKRIEIVGTDISEKALKRAKAGLYSQFEVQRGMPSRLLLKYFQQQGKDWQLKDEVRQMVRFQPHNLLKPLPTGGPFDVVFCRNVLIYFDNRDKQKVIGHVAERIAPGGFLLLGGAESLIGISDRFSNVDGSRGLYRRHT